MSATPDDPSSFIVVFKVEDHFRKAFLDALQTLGFHEHLTPTAGFLTTSISLKSIMERLQPLLGKNDDIWVFTPGQPWSSYGDLVVEDHVEAKVGAMEDYIPQDWNDALDHREN